MFTEVGDATSSHDTPSKAVDSGSAMKVVVVSGHI